MSKPRILIGSPIRQQPAILTLFLDSLRRLEHPGLESDYMFVDDNTLSASSELLRTFAEAAGRTRILQPSEPEPGDTVSGEAHQWRESAVWKVAAMKDRILAHALDGGYTHVFLADSDLLFHPATLQQLLRAERDIVSAVYWTRWQPETMEMPQVWLHGEYEHYPLNRQQEAAGREQELLCQRFFAQLRQPGLYEVGGLGACTLISRAAMVQGASFGEIKNLSYWGEDRHFCVRAAALGMELFVETTYPAYHIYRDEDMAGAVSYIEASLETEPTQAGMVQKSAYQTARTMLDYGYDLVAEETLRLCWERREGDVWQQVDVLLELDASYGRHGDPGRGRALLLEAVDELRRAELYCRLGSKCMDDSNWREAASWFRAAIGTPRPADWERSTDGTSWTWKPYIQLCVCSVQLNELRKAFDYNERGLAFEPVHPTMLANRQALLRMLNETAALAPK